MNRRLLCVVALIGALLMAAGLSGLDRPLAEWVHTSGLEQARVFAIGLGTLDWLAGMRLSFWLAGGVALAIGLAGIALYRQARWPRMFLVAGAVQYLCIATMIAGKNHFGRLRPQQVLAAGDWSHVWYAGGASFPSGHSAFYFGLLLPLAAAVRPAWLRALLLAIPLYAVLARIDLARHFLSDVSASALMAALYALAVSYAVRRWLPPPQSVAHAAAHATPLAAQGR